MKTRSFLRGLGYPVRKPEIRDEALYGIVWLANRGQREAAKVLRRYSLIPATFNYLMVVKHIGGTEGLSQREIATRLLLDPSSVTRVLNKLERKGLIARNAGPDQRSHRITITDKGDRTLNDAWPDYKKVIHRLTASLSESACRRLVGVLSHWRDSLDE